MTRPLLAVAALTALGCNTARGVWETATRNSRYRGSLVEAVADTETMLAQAAGRRRSIEGARGVMADYEVELALEEVDRERATLRAHLAELRREDAELRGDVLPRRRRCPIHGDWMVREVIATEASDAPSASRLARRIEIWKFPHHGRAAFYGASQSLPYTRPWICRGCQEARAHWQPRLERHHSGSWPANAEHLLLEVVAAVEGVRSGCEQALHHVGASARPFHIAASFAALPTGALSKATFSGSEDAVGSPLAQCFNAHIDYVRLERPPDAPLAIVRLPLWTEL